MTEFLAAMAAAGLVPHGDLQLVEGKLARFRVQGDKAGSRNGWAVFHSRPAAAGSFGSWRTGETHTFREPPRRDETAAQRAERRRHRQAMRDAYLAEQERVREYARARALKLWGTARPATDVHTYLRAKGVHAYGLRQLKQMLVIPARDTAGTLHTLQFIGPDGTKRFLTGGRIMGCYCSIGRVAGCIYLAEGYATAATVHAATGHAVAVCFNAGNLKAVALALRARFPDLCLVIAADNDVATPGNPGVTAAFDAAAAAGALVAVPELSEVAR